MMAKSKVEHVVVDAVAFFRNVQLQDIADNVHSLQAVVSEIRDKATRQRLAVLPFELKLREPAPECIRIVSDFARKTGDYQSLSAVDIRVMALAYQLTKEVVGTDHLKKEPEKKATYSSTKKNLESVKDIAGFYYPSKKSADSGDSAKPDQEQTGDVVLKLSGLEENAAKDVVGLGGGDGGGGGKEGGVREEANDEEVVVGCKGVEDEEDSVQRTSKAEEEDEVMEEGVQTESRGGDGDKMEEKSGDDRTDTNNGMNEADPNPVIGDTEGGMDVKDEDEGELNEEEEDAEVDDEGEEPDDEDDDDDVGWITPQNISQVRQQMGGRDEASVEGIKVGCMTTDFAMQNVLIQMGIPVISVNGMLIKRAKSFALRCHDCFKVTHDMGKVFCPKCGNQSLDKVTVSVDEDGTQRYHLSRRRPVNARGLRYALPKPQGGKHASNPIVCADQRLPQNRQARKAQARTNVFDPDYEAMNSPFATHDLTSRSAQLGVRRLGGQGSGNRRNPNENRRGKKGKRR